MIDFDYIIVSPVRNEAEYIQRTIESVLAQTILPKQWIIVNDGSTDATGRIIDEAAKRYSWIKAVHRQGRGIRVSGGGDMGAFFPGIKMLHHRPAGAAYGGWANWVKNGRANYAAGYDFVFMVLKCVSRIFRKPYGVAALGLWVGFCSGYVNRIWRIDDRALIRYVRTQQIHRLLGQPSLWSKSRKGDKRPK